MRKVHEYYEHAQLVSQEAAFWICTLLSQLLPGLLPSKCLFPKVYSMHKYMNRNHTS